MLRFVIITLLSFCFAIVLAQNSLLYYLEQRFHTDFGLEEKIKGSNFSKAGEIFSAFEDFIQKSVKILQRKKAIIEVADKVEIKPKTIEPKPELNITENTENIENTKNRITLVFDTNSSLINSSSLNSTFKESVILESDFKDNKIEQVLKTNEQIYLQKGDGVLFIGDSLMQYIGLMARKILPAKGLKVLDLSKQSTGLIDRKGHNWNKVLEDTLKTNDNIKLVVVLLGANDPWARSINGVYKDVPSDEWQEFYSGRIDEIYSTAQSYGAKVLWLSMPCMKKPDFSKKTEILNTLFKRSNDKYFQYFMDTRQLVCENNEYKTHININGKQTKIRQDDGIHMNKAGCDIIAYEIEKRLEIE